MTHPLQCKCGTLKGIVDTSQMAVRSVCYCRDCRAFANYLARSDDILDAQGGTAIVATLPKSVSFTQGVDVLVCMSLSPKGLLRWYTNCCNTPIGNTPRNAKMSYVGLIHSGLEAESPSLEESFGAVALVVNSKSAKAPVRSPRIRNVIGLLTIMKSVISARFNGGYKVNPFYKSDLSGPIKQPIVLTKAERMLASAST
jgi:Family of unknown function (DUF6151)